MITFGEYVAYEKLQSKEEIKAWLHDENTIFSNLENYESIIENLCTFKDSIKRDYTRNPNTKVYKNIYGHELTIMIPLGLPIEKKKQFVEEYMKSLDYCYSTKHYLYCYKFISEGNGNYVQILCFTRKIYKKKQKRLLTYNSDYYFDEVNKRRCTMNNPNAVRLHKKGEPKLDKDGNKIYQEYVCSPIEKELFKYTSFSRFLKMLKKCVEYVKRILLNSYNKRRFFSYITTPKKLTVLSKKKISLKNQLIKTINTEMYNVPSQYFDTSISRMGFDKTFDRDNYLLRKSYYRMINQIENALRRNEFINPFNNKNINLSLHQSFIKYRENLAELEGILIEMIHNWFDESFYPYQDGAIDVLTACGIEYERLIKISLIHDFSNLHSFTAVKNVISQQIQEIQRRFNKNIWLSEETNIFNNFGLNSTWILGSRDTNQAYIFSDEQKAKNYYTLLTNN